MRRFFELLGTLRRMTEKPAKPPKVRPLSATEEDLMFHYNHSQGIFFFSLVERQLATVVSGWTGESEAGILFNAFYGIDTFRGKLEFADRYMQHRLGAGDKEAVKPWKRAYELCQKAADNRNKLAHWYSARFPNEKKGMRVVLVPPSFGPSTTFALDKRAEQPGMAPGYSLGVLGLLQIQSSAMKAFYALVAMQAIMKGNGDSFPMFINVGLPESDLNVAVEGYRAMVRASLEG